MDAFESLVSMLLRHVGYWTVPSFRVELTDEDKEEIGRRCSPRWELDVLAYDARSNIVRVVECKSFLDSRGVHFREGKFGVPKRYKLFVDDNLREVVFGRLRQQLFDKGMCRENPTVKLALAVGKIAGGADRDGLEQYLAARGATLYGPEWVCEKLRDAGEGSRGYENDVAFIVSKLLMRSSQ